MAHSSWHVYDERGIRDQKASYDDDSGRQAFNDIFGLLGDTACM